MILRLHTVQVQTVKSLQPSITIALGLIRKGLSLREHIILILKGSGMLLRDPIVQTQIKRGMQLKGCIWLTLIKRGMLLIVSSTELSCTCLYNQLQDVNVLIAVLTWSTFTRLLHTTLLLVGLPLTMMYNSGLGRAGLVVLPLVKFQGFCSKVMKEKHCPLTSLK